MLYPAELRGRGRDRPGQPRDFRMGAASGANRCRSGKSVIPAEAGSRFTSAEPNIQRRLPFGTSAKSLDPRLRGDDAWRVKDG